MSVAANDYTNDDDDAAEAARGAQRKRKQNLKRLGLLGSIVSSLSFVFIALSGGLVAGAPVIAAAFAWDRVSNLFDDRDWKNAVQKVASFQLDTERENLVLYKPLYFNGKKVADQDNSHWINFGKTNATIYRPAQGKSTYTFDMGKEVLVSDILLVMACKNCAVAAVTSEDAPPDPADASKKLTPDQVGAYYTPTQNFPDALLNNTGRKAAANSISSERTSARYITLFMNNKDADCYLVQLAAYPPGKRSNVLWAGLPGFGADYTSVYSGKVSTALGLPNGSGSNLMLPPRTIHQLGQNKTYYGPVADADPNTHLPIYPLVGAGGNTGAGTGSLGDATTGTGYRKVYLGWQLHPSSVGKLQEIGIRWSSSWSPTGGNGNGGGGSGTPTPSPTPDGGFGSVPTPTPGGPTTTATPGGNGTPTPGSPPPSPTAKAITTPTPVAKARVGAGASNNIGFGVGTGAGNNKNGGSISGFSLGLAAASPTPTPTPTVTVLPSPPSASHWKLYFLNSQDSTQKALLDALFSSNANAQTVDGTALPDDLLLKDFTDPTQVSLPNVSMVAGDARDTLVFVFVGSNYNQELQSLTGNGGNPALTPSVPGQLNGLPPDWLSPAEIYAYERPPLPPTQPPRSANSSSSGPGYQGPRSGQFDIRYGSITAERIEQILQDFPFTGVAPGGLPAGLSNPPRNDGKSGTANLLTGKGQFFVDMGKKYKINPTYALAMARKESSLFTTGVILYNGNTGEWGNNGYGITFNPLSGTGGWLSDKCLARNPQVLVGGDNIARYFCKYATIEDSIEDYFGLLAEGYAGGQLAGGRYGNLTTIDQIIAVYAPASDGNDTQQYINQIKSWVSDWQTDPNSGPNGQPIVPPVGNLGPVPAINQYDCSQYDGTYPCGVWADSTCGPTSATMVINWLSGQHLRVADTLVYAAGNGVSPSGTYGWAYLDQMQSVFGFTWRKQAYNSTEEYISGLKDLTGAGQPVVANIVGAPYYAGHFLVVIAYNLEDNSFTINDPANVTQPGNPPGVVQKWPAPKLADYLAGRIGGGYPAIIITPAGGTTGGKPTPSPSPSPAPPAQAMLVMLRLRYKPEPEPNLN